MITGYLGPEDSYSHLAAKKMTPQATLAPYSGFLSLMRALTSGEVDCTVIPIENSLNGGVLQNIDLLQATDGVIAVEELAIKIEHRLATLEGAKLEDITTVYSHPQALEQCSRFCDRLTHAKLITTSSTAASLQMIKTEHDAGIVGAHVKKSGIVLSPYSISDYPDNSTRFLKVVRGTIDENAKSKRIYFSVTCRNISGELMRLLSRLAEHGLNMSKLESRPIKDASDEFRFFIEAEGDYSASPIKAAIKDIRSAALSFKILGAY